MPDPPDGDARGTAHGGLLMWPTSRSATAWPTRRTRPASLTTANLSADFAGSAKLGAAYLSVGDERIVRASAVFVRGGRSEA